LGGGSVIDVLLEPTMWFGQLQRHVLMSVIAIALATVIGVVVGSALTRAERAAFAVVSIANLGRTIPSLALLAIVYPFVGTGLAPSIIALTALAIPPVLLATFTGIREVDPDVRDAAQGLGLSSIERLRQVELPCAAPVVLDGIRTASVQVVASATLAALIGGGGLGELIMSGLSTMEYDLLLAGAVLVGLLAACTELGFSTINRRVLPDGVRHAAGASTTRSDYVASAALDPRRWRMVALVAVTASIAIVGAGSVASAMVSGIGMPDVPNDGSRPRIVVGSKDFTEQFVLAELYAQALEAKGFPVERKLGLGATAVADAALRSGRIDVYPEYTGTALTAVLKESVPTAGAGTEDPDAAGPGLTGPAAIDAAITDTVRSGYGKRGLRVLQPTPFSNGNAIVMARATAEQHGVETLSDLATIASELRFAAIPGFESREDGLPLLKERYGIEFGDVRTYENALKYRALVDGKVDAVYGFETDGQIAANDLVLLRDDKAVWPPYHAAPIVSSDIAKRGGKDLAATLDAVTALLDTKTMQQLNYQVETKGKDPEDVAQAFLRKHDLA
jgi:osmoprotectant transport system permease protein